MFKLLFTCCDLFLYGGMFCFPEKDKVQSLYKFEVEYKETESASPLGDILYHTWYAIDSRLQVGYCTSSDLCMHVYVWKSEIPREELDLAACVCARVCMEEKDAERSNYKELDLADHTPFDCVWVCVCACV